MKHALQSPTFIDPFWFNEMRRGTKRGIAVAPDAIEVLGETLRVTDRTLALVPGETVHVTLYRDFFFQTEAEGAEEQRVAQLERERKKLQEKAEARIRKARADAFNASLRVPGKWVPGQKDVTSGLREDSWGDGSYKKSVVHILLLEPIVDGKFRREAGMFLCSSSWQHNGKNWSGQPELGSLDANGEWYAPEVTCKACLKTETRWEE